MRGKDIITLYNSPGAIHRHNSYLNQVPAPPRSASLALSPDAHFHFSSPAEGAFLTLVIKDFRLLSGVNYIYKTLKTRLHQMNPSAAHAQKELRLMILVQFVL